MRQQKLLIVMAVFVTHVTMAQELEITNNGRNLENVCPTDACMYLYFQNNVYFPFEKDKDWEIQNLEVATKKNGNFLSSGDLYIQGVDTAAIISYTIEFYSEVDELLYSHVVPEFEFYNETGRAEPIYTSGKMDAELATKVNYLDLTINSSQRLPYYEIAADCYQACKEHGLKEAIKAFKKSK